MPSVGMPVGMPQECQNALVECQNAGMQPQ